MMDLGGYQDYQDYQDRLNTGQVEYQYEYEIEEEPGKISLDRLEFNRGRLAIVKHLRDRAKKEKGEKNWWSKFDRIQVDDLIEYTCFWKVLLIRFRPETKLSPVFVSKEAVVKKLCPSQNRGLGQSQSVSTSNLRPHSSPPLFDDIRQLSPRISAVEYFTQYPNYKKTWTHYLAYEEKESAVKMSVYLHQKELAWHSVVRPVKRIGILEYNPNHKWELKIWGACETFVSKLIEKDLNDCGCCSRISKD